jgi:carnosine N-methyltransferase
MISALFEILRCPECRTGIIEPRGALLRCRGCGEQFPIVAAVPILVRDSASYIADFYSTLEEHVTDQQTHALRLNAISDGGLRSTTVLKQAAVALSANAQLLAECAAALKSHVDVRAMVRRGGSGHSAKPLWIKLALRYLRRDWCWFEECELEVAAIQAAIGDSIRSVDCEGPALVMGAGTGRLVAEVGRIHPIAIGLDYSFLMPFLFSRVRDGDIPFYHYNLLSARSPDVAIQPIVATRRPVGKLDKIEYLSGDALAAPFADGSMAAIVAAYFTDMVPVTRLIAEVRRLLKPGGVFVHYGPLHYPEMPHEQMFTATELMEAFRLEGFRTLVDGTSRSTHLACAGGMASLAFDNWVFVARRE